MKKTNKKRHLGGEVSFVVWHSPTLNARLGGLFHGKRSRISQHIIWFYVVWSISFIEMELSSKEKTRPVSEIDEYAKLTSWGWYAWRKRSRNSYCFSYNGYVIFYFLSLYLFVKTNVHGLEYSLYWPLSNKNKVKKSSKIEKLKSQIFKNPKK